MGQGANRETKASNRSAVGLGGIVSATKSNDQHHEIGPALQSVPRNWTSCVF